MPEAEGDVVMVSQFEAADVPDAHAVEGVVHEVLDRGEQDATRSGSLSSDADGWER
jgi:hypothetical protein